LTELKRLVAKYVNEYPIAPLTLNQALITLTPDANDVPVLAGAVYSDADWLVSANGAHFGHLYYKSVRNVLVLPPGEALRRLVENTGLPQP